MSTIDAFKASLVGGGTRSNQFRVDLTFPTIVNNTAVAGGLAQFMVTGAALPGSTIEKVEVGFRGRKVPLTGDRTFEPWTIKVLNDTNFALHSVFNDWMNAMNNVKNNSGITNSSSYTSDLTVTQLDRNGLELMQYKIIGAWPQKVADIALSFDDGKVEDFDVTFEYLYWQSTAIGGV